MGLYKAGVLQPAGVGDSVSLTSEVTGTLPIANGGTNKTTWTQHALALATASNVLGELATGTGVLIAAGAAPAYSASPSLTALTLSGSAGLAISNATQAVLGLTNTANASGSSTVSCTNDTGGVLFLLKRGSGYGGALLGSNQIARGYIYTDGDLSVGSAAGKETTLCSNGGIVFKADLNGYAVVAPSGGRIGNYGSTPVALQTGVAVTAAAIHAALVNLNLITA